MILPWWLNNARDSGSVPGLGRCPGERNGNPLQYSCLKNSMDRGVCGSQKSQIWLGNCKQTTKNSKTSDPSWQKYWYVAKLCRLSLTFFRSTMKPSWWLALYPPVKIGAEGLKALVKQVDFTGLLGGSDHPMAETGQEKYLGPVSLTSPHTHLPHTWHKLTMHLLCYQTENVAINFFKEYCKADLFLIIVSKS